MSRVGCVEILSLGRNKIKRLENLDSVSDTLKELWISYNLISKLSGIEKLKHLEIFYISNNDISSWKEIDRLVSPMNTEYLRRQCTNNINYSKLMKW